MRHVEYSSNYEYWYDEHNVHLKINVQSNVDFPTSFTAMGVSVFLPSALIPKERVTVPNFVNANTLIAIATDGKIYRRSMTGASVSTIMQAYLSWHY